MSPSRGTPVRPPLLALLLLATSATTLADTPTRAPWFTGMTRWINSPLLTIEGLRGKVVLVDFWTSSASTSRMRCRW